MPKVAVMYTLQGCPWCVKCKAHLRNKGYKIKEKKIQRGEEPKELPDGRKKYTYPQVFLLIGGYEDTVKKIKK